MVKYYQDRVSVSHRQQSAFLLMMTVVVFIFLIKVALTTSIKLKSLDKSCVNNFYQTKKPRLMSGFFFARSPLLGRICGLFYLLTLGLKSTPGLDIVMARPTVITKEVLSKLDTAFSMGCTDLEACNFADISKATLYRYQEDNEAFRDRKEVLKANPFMLARSVLIDALHDGDVNTAHKMIDRKEGSKVSVDHSSSDGSMQPTMIQLMPVSPDDNSND